jgi:hypothetical protein
MLLGECPLLGDARVRSGSIAERQQWPMSSHNDKKEKPSTI